MFLWVENRTWPSLDHRQKREAVRKVWDWKKPLGSFPLFLVQALILELCSGVLGN